MFLPWHLLHNSYFQLFLSIPVYFIGIIYFGKSAWYSLKSGVPNMDVLIIIGALAAFIYSISGMFLFQGTEHVANYLFFETGATIICFVLLGNLIEKNSIKKTTSSIQSLSKLQVKTAKVVEVVNGVEVITEKEVESIKPGTLIAINSGDSVPLDSIITNGQAEIDESMITGESLAILKKTGDAVIGGTIVVDGNLFVKVTSNVKQSVLAGIIEMVKNAQTSKPKVQRLGDKVSAIFVPAVIAISLITFLVSFFILDLKAAESLLRSVAVLVISCPCAMGLATPTAVMVGIGKAARHGVLIKGGDVLEELAKAKTIIFDKTGTLTSGKIVVDEFKVLNGSESDLKNLVYNIEQSSSHPIARAIVRNHNDWFKNKVLFNEVKEIKGIGMSCVGLNGDRILLGSANISNQINTGFDLYLIINDKLAASLNIIDELREGSNELIAYFNSENIRTILLSGDKKEKVIQVKESLNISEAHWAQMPEQKMQFIENLSKQSDLAMVGDGINDAPSLSKANVGISFSDATDIARQSSNVVIIRKEVEAIRDAHVISKQTYQTIKQNLFWAFFYNILAIPLAAAGYLHPMIAALSMAFSDIIVIGNSIRLGFRKTK